MLMILAAPGSSAGKTQFFASSGSRIGVNEEQEEAEPDEVKIIEFMYTIADSHLMLLALQNF